MSVLALSAFVRTSTGTVNSELHASLDESRVRVELALDGHVDELVANAYRHAADEGGVNL